MVGHRFGRGPLRVSLIAGCHGDEPTGPRLLRRLASCLDRMPPSDPLLELASWWLIPDMNPDAAAANASWSEGETVAFDPRRHAAEARREAPGDDVEYGFPRSPDDRGARPENLAAAAFLRSAAPLHLHASLHSLAVGEGPWFLIDPAWAERSRPLRERLSAEVDALGYRLHDVDRRGEKGFWRIDRGFATTPDSGSMRRHFLDRGDEDIAARFRPTSMELARSLGGEPLTLVSEVPLFVWKDQRGAPVPEGSRPGPAERARLAELVAPVPIADQMRLQVALLAAGLDLVRDQSAG